MMNRLKSAEPRLLTILLIVFVQIVGASMILPILPLYAQRHFAMKPQVITLVVSSFFAAQFLAGPTIGRLSDKYGRLPVLIVSQVGTVISFVMLGLAGSFEVLFLARILDGITGGNIIVAQAYITDIMPREQRTQALGYIFAAFGLGFVFGPALGGILSALLGDRIPFLIAAIAATITVLITGFALDETITPQQREHNRTHTQASLNLVNVTRNYPLLLILLVAFGGQFAFGLLQSTFALFGEAVLFAGYSERVVNLGVGLLLGTTGLGQFLTQMFLLKPLLRRFGDARLALIGTVIRGCSLLIYAVITSFWLGPIGAILFATGTGLMMPPLQSLSTRTVADNLRGGVLGWYQSATSLGIIFSTALAGTLFAIAPRLPYWTGGMLFFVMTLPVLVVVRWAHTSADEPRTASTAAAD